MKLAKNFSLGEFVCRDEHATPVPEQYMDNVTELAANLQALRDHVAQPVHVICGYRTTEHNKAVGGVVHSQHLVARAADIVVSTLTPKELAAKIEQLIVQGKMKQGGLGVYRGFIHYDIRGKRARW